MRFAVETYAQAFLEAARGKKSAAATSQLVERFMRAIRKNGDLGRKKSILEAIERRHIRNEGRHWVRIEYARLMQARKLERVFAAGDHVTTALNPELIAGARITIDGEHELDWSLARKLKKLFNAHS